MKLNVSMRMRIFVISVCIIISGQVIYSKKNVESFQKSYLETLQMKCQKLGEFLKDDIEYVLSLNIPFAKLAKLENTLREILDVIPELEFIEITDREGHVLHYAAHKSVTHIEAETTLSSFNEEATLKTRHPGLNLSDVDTLLPVFHRRENQHVGYIKMRLSPEVIVSKSREILWDMITVILTSLLITFEMLTFFVSYSITDPLERMVKEVEGGRPLPVSLIRKRLFVRE